MPIKAEPAAGVVLREPIERDRLLWCNARYVCGPLVVGDGWERRRFVRPGATIEVTVAEMPMKPTEYEAWERQARDYPAASLNRSRVSGFFTCAGDGGAPPCDLHAQSEAGSHFELSGRGNATRGDLEELFNGLNWK